MVSRLVRFGGKIRRVKGYVKPFLSLARVDKPIGTLLLFYPSATAILMASHATDASLSLTLSTTALFLTGLLMILLV